MEIQSWIVVQLGVDLLMFGLLVLLLKAQLANRPGQNGLKQASEKSESLLEEMRQLSLGLERNLDEKRALTQRILEELDRRLNQAEAVSLQLKALHASDKTPITLESIRELRSKGFSIDDIAKRLDIPVGEVALTVKLQADAPRKAPGIK
jgi:DNA-directed RNA polymerase specialized sigma24 family protein